MRKQSEGDSWEIVGNLSSAYAVPWIRKGNASEKVAKAESPPLNGRFIPLEPNAPIQRNLKGMVYHDLYGSVKCAWCCHPECW